MEPETRATSFEKDAHKTKDNTTKGKTRSNSLFTISSGFTFFAALPGGSSSSSFSMNELRSFRPRRRDLDFKELDRDIPDEEYEIFFNNLHVEVWGLARMAFLPGGYSVGTRRSPWLREYPEEFLRYVELVAHPDARTNHWERLLCDKDERVCLLMAIIFRILDKKVFSTLLFGAGPIHGETLKNSDTELIYAEGFERSSLRSHSTRTWLKTTYGVPPLFWQEVDKLCTQMLAMLLPFFNYVKEASPCEAISTSELYQSLHDVVAYAGWLSVCIRMSPAIISIDWTIPGELYSAKFVNMSQEAYETSKKRARVYDKYDIRPWSMRKLSTARVKISVTPKIVRHKPLPESLAINGITSYTIMKPSVVFYEGYNLEQDERKAFISLPDYIQKLRDLSCVPRYTALAIILVTLIWMWVFYTASGQQTWQAVLKTVKSRLQHEGIL
ncbi:hypothetical protein FLONG3_1468 [Fusarium longipes]|uniref:Uncharacterized protein n=1 Tax=Fusarium longipes TaxID=694270 RepID=A0A395T7B7_9HYPO|nr:hypothetical protein FLONG3_1468 [Fusarium longipes]